MLHLVWLDEENLTNHEVCTTYSFNIYLFKFNLKWICIYFGAETMRQWQINSEK